MPGVELPPDGDLRPVHAQERDRSARRIPDEHVGAEGHRDATSTLTSQLLELFTQLIERLLSVASELSKDLSDAAADSGIALDLQRRSHGVAAVDADDAEYLDPPSSIPELEPLQ